MSLRGKGTLCCARTRASSTLPHFLFPQSYFQSFISPDGDFMVNMEYINYLLEVCSSVKEI